MGRWFASWSTKNGQPLEIRSSEGLGIVWSGCSGVELGVDSHDRKGRRQLVAANLPKTVLLVEAMSCKVLGGGSQVNLLLSAGSAPGKQCLQQALGNTVLGPAMAGGDEHLAQRPFAVAHVEDSDCSDDGIVYQGDPEVAVAALVESGNLGEIRLFFAGDRDCEFSLLDGKYDREHTLGMLGREPYDVDGGHVDDV